MIRYDTLMAVMAADPPRTDASKAFHAYLKEARVVRLSRSWFPDLTARPAPMPIGVGVINPVFPILFVECEGGIVVPSGDSMNDHKNDVPTRTVDAWLIVCCAVEKPSALTPERVPETMLAIVALGEDSFTADLAPTGKMLVGWAGYGEDGELQRDRDDPPYWTPAAGIGRNILDLLASPSVLVERDPDVDRINHARKRNGKPPLTEWHTVTWSDMSGVSTETGTGLKHRVRYDVRGNWATFRVGPLAGRRIFRRAHQRGLANETFRPKGYMR